jgi:hypothetical protein
MFRIIAKIVNEIKVISLVSNVVLQAAWKLYVTMHV